MLTDRQWDNWPNPDEEAEKLFKQVQDMLLLSDSLLRKTEEIRGLRQHQNHRQPDGLHTFIIQPEDDADKFIQQLQAEVKRLRDDYGQLVNTCRSLGDSMAAVVAYQKKLMQEITKLKGKK